MTRNKKSPVATQIVAFANINSHRADWRERAAVVCKTRRWSGAVAKKFLANVEKVIAGRREAQPEVPAEQAGQSGAQRPFNGISIPTSLVAAIEQFDG